MFLRSVAAYFEKGDYDQTIATCEKSIDEARALRADYKIIAKAFTRIGSTYVKKDDLDNAIIFFNKSLAEHRAADTLEKLKETEKLKKKREDEAYLSPELAEKAREEGNAKFKVSVYKIGASSSY